MDYITTANVLVFVFLTLGLFLMFVSYWVAAAALFPRHVERCAEQFRRPIVAVLIGLLAGVAPIAMGMWALQALPAAFKWLGLMIVAAPIFVGLIGSAGLAQRIGNGLATPQDAREAWRPVGRGGVVLALTFLLPILGQALLIPLVLAAGLGTSVFAWAGRWKESRSRSTPIDAPLESPQPQP